jgi:flavin reductase (DIM6/NTAB) family NADH-FMN oxidoreductase RutF
MIKQFKEIEIKSLTGNVFQMLDNDWMLVTAGTKESFNLMTASWGTFGMLWNLPIAIAFIRPHRHTFNFISENSHFSLSFFNSKYRDILNFCGKHSGRAVDKVKETGLIPVFTDSGSISFEQAQLIIECRKIYTDDIKADKFIDKEIINTIYPTKDFHRMFIGEIIHCFSLNKIQTQK